jgi:DNA-binding transcriptional ArsR family regulator
MVQYSPQLDSAFAALSDPTRRGILEQLGRSDASISDLAAKFEITLTGLKKHVHILEQSGFVTSKKVGRVRTCRLGPRRLDAEAAWLDKHRQMVESRLDRLGEFLERTKGKS